MNLREDIKPVTFMKTQSAKLIATVTQNRRPVVITQNGEARVVIQDVDSYENTKKALLLLKIAAQGEADIRAGRVVPQEEVFRKIRKLIKKHAKSKQA